MRRGFGWLAAAGLAAAAGCGQPVYPVRGTVRFADGSPLAVGRVVAHADGSPVGSWGYLRDDGSFDLGTHTPTDGAPAGTYRVSIENAVTNPPPGYSDPRPFVSRPLVHPRYADKGTSGLTFEVPRDVVWEITVERP